MNKNPTACVDGAGHRFSVSDDFRRVQCEKCWINYVGDFPASVTMSWKIGRPHSARRIDASQERFYAIVGTIWLLMAVSAAVLGHSSTCFQFVTIAAIYGGVSAILRRLREVSE